jgi:serine/threonine-protein kinase
MAPERLGTGDVGPSSDVYSLACVLYECLTGQLPFLGESLEQQIAGHLTKPPPRPSAVTADVPPAFDEVVARGMAKNAGERFPTVIALGEAARAALEREPRETPPPHAMPTRFADTQMAATQRVPGSGPSWPPPGPGYPQDPCSEGHHRPPIPRNSQRYLPISNRRDRRVSSRLVC